jgi:hypothetical protein
MRIALLATALAFALGGVAHAGIIYDPIGDFEPGSLPGQQVPDLEIASFYVNYDAATEIFRVGGTQAGPIIDGPARACS